MRHRESELQRSCVLWFKIQYREFGMLLFAIPNGGKRDAREAARLRAEGVTAGVADIFLSIPNQQYHGLYIEMKTDKGRQSERQKAFQSDVERKGYAYTICRSLEEFQQAIKQYMKDEK